MMRGGRIEHRPRTSVRRPQIIPGVDGYKARAVDVYASSTGRVVRFSLNLSSSPSPRRCDHSAISGPLARLLALLNVEGAAESALHRWYVPNEIRASRIRSPFARCFSWSGRGGAEADDDRDQLVSESPVGESGRFG